MKYIIAIRRPDLEPQIFEFSTKQDRDDFIEDIEGLAEDFEYVTSECGVV